MKALKSFVVALLALTILCGVAFGIGWGITGTYDLTKWFKAKPNESQNENEGGNGSLVVTPNPTDNYVKLSVTPLSDEGSFMVTEADENGAVSYSSSSNISINATVYMPDGSAPKDLQYVVWEISNPDAGVTMKVNGTTATFETSGFSEQLTVTCRSRFDFEKYATVTLDYARRPIDTKITLLENEFLSSDSYRHGIGASINYINIHIPYTDYAREAMEGVPFYEDYSLYFCTGIVYGLGSVNNAAKNIKVDLELSNRAKENIESELGQREVRNITRSYEGLNLSDSSVTSVFGFSLLELIGPDGFMPLSEAEYEGENDVYGKYLKAIASNEEEIGFTGSQSFNVSVTVDLQYGGQRTFYYTISIYLDYEVGDVGLDIPPSIIL